MSKHSFRDAIAGTHVVFLAMDMDKADAGGLMGTAIQREDKIEKGNYLGSWQPVVRYRAEGNSAQRLQQF